MMRSSLIKAIWVLITVLFLSAQSFSQAHAAMDAGTDHSHECLICDVAVSAAEQTAIEPPLPIAAPFKPVVTAAWISSPATELPRSFDGRAPPPRGPPAK